MSVHGAGPVSRRLYRRAQQVLVGGVDSPVRAFHAVGGTPVFFRRGAGAYLYDVDGRRYLDLVGSWGANLLGNAPKAVVEAVRRTARLALTFGAPSPLEHELAEEIQKSVPLMERLRFVSSGTEATMSAVRVARAATGRDKVVKFAGGYHGHSDGLLAESGSGVATQSLPGSAGVPGSVVADTLVAPYNDGAALGELSSSLGDQVAAIIVEPVAGNMGVVPPRSDFIAAINQFSRRSGALVIADEVITGFRLCRGTFHDAIGLHADLVTLGKVIGGGLPVAAFGGRQRLLDQVAPLGPVYQAGTLSGNPLGMAAGLATLKELTPKRYRALEVVSSELESELHRMGTVERKLAFRLNRMGSMLGLYFTREPVVDLRSASATRRSVYAAFFHAALRAGIYLPPSPMETTFVSMALTLADLRRSARGFAEAFHAAAKAVPR